MKRCKRNPLQRVFTKGYQAGSDNRSRTSCPYDAATEIGQSWLQGWREGRTDQYDGYSLRAVQAKIVSF